MERTRGIEGSHGGMNSRMEEWMIGFAWNMGCGYNGMTCMHQMTTMGLEFLAYERSHTYYK